MLTSLMPHHEDGFYFFLFNRFFKKNLWTSKVMLQCSRSVPRKPTQDEEDGSNKGRGAHTFLL